VNSAFCTAVNTFPDKPSLACALGSAPCFSSSALARFSTSAGRTAQRAAVLFLVACSGLPSSYPRPSAIWRAHSIAPDPGGAPGLPTCTHAHAHQPPCSGGSRWPAWLLLRVCFMHNPFAYGVVYTQLGCPLRSVGSSTQIHLILRPDYLESPRQARSIELLGTIRVGR
jgi:hypothetical protein